MVKTPGSFMCSLPIRNSSIALGLTLLFVLGTGGGLSVDAQPSEGDDGENKTKTETKNKLKKKVNNLCDKLDEKDYKTRTRATKKLKELIRSEHQEIVISLLQKKLDKVENPEKEQRLKHVLVSAAKYQWDIEDYGILPDKHWMLVAPYNGNVQMYSMVTRKVVRDFGQTTNGAKTVAISPDGMYLAIPEPEGDRVMIFDRKEDQVTTRINPAGSPVLRMEFAESDPLLGIRTGKYVAIWNWQTGTKKKKKNVNIADEKPLFLSLTGSKILFTARKKKPFGEKKDGLSDLSSSGSEERSRFYSFGKPLEDVVWAGDGSSVYLLGREELGRLEVRNFYLTHSTELKTESPPVDLARTSSNQDEVFLLLMDGTVLRINMSGQIKGKVKTNNLQGRGGCDWVPGGNYCF